MRAKTLTWTSVALLLATLVSIALVDRPLAVMISEQLGGAMRVAGAITTGLEFLFAFDISKYLYAFLLLLVGVVFYVARKSAAYARKFYFVGGTILTSRLVSGTLKNVFERVRPHEFLKSREPADFFVDGGSAFPSGHAAFYFGLFFPLALLWPKMKWPLLGVAALAALARVFELDHYLSDILGSAIVAVLLVFLLAKLLRLPAAANREPTQ